MNKVSRRGFIGSLLMSVPAVRAIAAIAALREAEYQLIFATGWPDPITIATFTNGTIIGRYGSRPMETIIENGWVRLRGMWRDGDTRCAECKVRRVDSKTLDIDWLNIWGPRATYHDDFWFAPNLSNAPAFISTGRAAVDTVTADFFRLKA